MPKKPPSPSAAARDAKAARKTDKGTARQRPRDVALVAGPTADGEGAHLLRVKDGQVSAGELRPAREGQPVQEGGELVRLTPMHEQLPICAVETLYGGGDEGAPAKRPPSRPRREGGGPARVSTERYRKNWNAVFGKPKKRGKDWSLN